MTTQPLLNFYGPVDELPAEGADLPELPAENNSVDRFASALSNSRIGFYVDRNGIKPMYPNPTPPVFQRANIEGEEENESQLNWADEAYQIDLDGLLSSSEPFSDMSDAAEPQDFVRRFLETLSHALDGPEIKTEGQRVPLIRWQPADSNDGATVQLLGLLVADKDQFEKFCNTDDDTFGLIFEDAEVVAHGLREAATALILLGVTLGSVQTSEAGLFKKMKEKRQAKMEQVMQEQMIQAVAAPIRQSTQWQDVHRDAYINYELLQNSEGAERKIVVDISRQRAFLIVNNTIAVDTAVSTAREGKHTPRGTFEITQRVRDGKTSTIYGCALPYWMRLDESAVGMHIGDLPGYPASAGCIRLPESVAPVIFDNTSSGITVEVVDSWNMQNLHPDSGQGGIFIADAS